MESKYYCSSCNYQANQKSHYDKHVLTLKHQKATQNQQKVNIETTQNQPLGNTVSKPTCKYCEKQFTTKQAMYRHIKYSCKKNDDEDIKELVRLLNLQQERYGNLEKENKAMQKQNKVMQKQIQQLTKKLQIQNMSNSHNNTMTNSHNTLNNNNNIYHIQILNHDQTDYSHLTANDYKRCIRDVNHCVKTLICKIHFDPNKPENHNIYISNIKSKYVMVYRKNQWDIVEREREIDNLYDTNHMVLEDWYTQYKDKHPEIVQSFERYLKNKDDDIDMIKEVKELIRQLLYNKRKVIKNTLRLLSCKVEDTSNETIENASFDFEEEVTSL
jgi:hypothetical protein